MTNEFGAIDLHTKHRQVRIVTAEGTVVVERRIVTRPDQFAVVFGGRARMRVLLESSTESEWVATCLEELGHEVVVADPTLRGDVRDADVPDQDGSVRREALRPLTDLLEHLAIALRRAAEQPTY